MPNSCLCPICNELKHPPGRACQPAWDIVIPSKGDDPSDPERVAYGSTAENAVVGYVENMCSQWADHPQDLEVWARLRDVSGSLWIKLVVSFEVVLSFHAERQE
jgi:hypothetical protein